MAGVSVARVYADANEKHGRAWWDYGTVDADKTISRCNGAHQIADQGNAGQL